MSSPTWLAISSFPLTDGFIFYFFKEYIPASILLFNPLVFAYVSGYVFYLVNVRTTLTTHLSKLSFIGISHP